MPSFLEPRRFIIHLKNVYCMIHKYFTCYLRLFINHAHVYENFKVLLFIESVCAFHTLKILF